MKYHRSCELFEFTLAAWKYIVTQLINLSLSLSKLLYTVFRVTLTSKSPFPSPIIWYLYHKIPIHIHYWSVSLSQMPRSHSLFVSVSITKSTFHYLLLSCITPYLPILSSYSFPFLVLLYPSEKRDKFSQSFAFSHTLASKCLKVSFNWFFFGCVWFPRI